LRFLISRLENAKADAEVDEDCFASLKQLVDNPLSGLDSQPMGADEAPALDSADPYP
jgi:hypothetical protein